MADARHPHQLAARQYLDHAQHLCFGENVALGAPHDQGGASQGLQCRPQGGPRRRAVPDPLLDVCGIHLPAPPAAGPLPEHTER